MKIFQTQNAAKQRCLKFEYLCFAVIHLAMEQLTSKIKHTKKLNSRILKLNSKTIKALNKIFLSYKL